MVNEIDTASAIEWGYSDATIIQDETDALIEITQDNHKRKSEIILAAAKKLEEKYPDTPCYCCQSHKDLEQAGYTPRHNPKSPAEKIQTNIHKNQNPSSQQNYKAIFLEMKTVYQQAGKLYGAYASKIEHDPKLKEIVLKELDQWHFHDRASRRVHQELMEQFKKIIDYKSWYSFIQSLGIECEAIERLMDERQKFPLAWKSYNLKILMVVKSYNHLCHTIRGS